MSISSKDAENFMLLQNDLSKLIPYIGKLSRMQELIYFLEEKTKTTAFPSDAVYELIDLRDRRLSEILKAISNKLQDGIYHKY